MAIYVRSGGNWQYLRTVYMRGLAQGLEVHGWHRIRYAYIRQGGVWVPLHNGVGAEPPSGLSAAGAHPGSAGADSVTFTATWAPGPGSTVDDYEVVGWTHNYLGPESPIIGLRTITIPSSPGHQHQVSFTCRSKAITTGAVGFQRPAGQAVDSGVWTFTDPRNQV